MRSVLTTPYEGINAEDHPLLYLSQTTEPGLLWVFLILSIPFLYIFFLKRHLQRLREERHHRKNIKSAG